MKREIKTLKTPSGNFDFEVLIFEETDRKRLKSIYLNWRSLCNELKSLNSRLINLPEGLSESSICLEMGWFRVDKPANGSKTVNSSWDCYDPVSKKRIQVKACSILPDLTSFGPKSEWDEIYFLDFYRKGLWDGSYDIYKIPNQLIYEHKVNLTQTFKDQQAQGRRPRFSIYESIIKSNDMSPLKTANIF